MELPQEKADILQATSLHIEQFHSHPDEGFALIDAKTHCIINCNPTYASLFNCNRSDELIGKSLEQLFAAPGDQGILSICQRVIDLQKPVFKTEYQSIQPTGEKMYWSLNFVPVGSNDGVVGVINIAVKLSKYRDTIYRLETARLMAEDRSDTLKRHTHLLEAMFENTYVCLAYLDPEYNFLRVNKAYARASRRSSDEFIGRNYFEMFPSRSRQALFDRVRETRVPYEEKESIVASSDLIAGPEYWNWSLVPVFDEHNQIEGFVLSLIELTDQVHTRQALERAYEREHRIAEVLQTALVPSVPSDMQGIEFAHAYQPGIREARVGGDFYDIFSVGDGKLAIIMADVSGKGLRAAVQTAMAKYTVRSYALEDPSPGVVLRRLNDAICRQIGFDGFLTLFYGVIDVDAQLFTCGNGGHEPPILIRFDDPAAAPIPISGPAIGVVPKTDFNELKVPLMKKDLLFLFTDGLTEARQGCSNFLGVSGAARLLWHNRNYPLKKMVDRILTEAIDFSGGNLEDDLAMLAFRLI
jgi:PAS domain S-box-containing protein